MSTNNNKEQIDISEIDPNFKENVAKFESLLQNGFPISVTLVSQGTVEFRHKGQLLEFKELDLEALKFYINTFMVLTDGKEKESTGTSS